MLGVVSFWLVVQLLLLSVSSQLPLMVLISFVFWLFFNSLLRTFVPRLARFVPILVETAQAPIVTF